MVTCLIIRWITKGARWTNIKQGKPRQTYQVIQSLLRVIRNGVECKSIVDEAIDACDNTQNLRENIQDLYQQYMSATNLEIKNKTEARGFTALSKYYMLILFQSYLDQNPPGMSNELMSFKLWLSMHPEFETIREQLVTNTIPHPLSPISESIKIGDGVASSLEVENVVNSRKGGVLARGTIIKYDVFPGAQMLSLSERIEGLHNFRRVNLTAVRMSIKVQEEVVSPTPMWVRDEIEQEQPSHHNSLCVMGVGMPSKDGIRRLLSQLGAGVDGNRTLFWTSLREEPVIYVKGRPHVLRLYQNPLKVSTLILES